MTTITTSPIMVPLGATATGETASLHLRDCLGTVRHALIIGGVASGKTTLVQRLARTAHADGLTVAHRAAPPS